MPQNLWAKMWGIMILRFLTDNHPVHHTTEIRQALQRTGALCIYLPPYCPQLNLIEMVFARFKNWLREHDILFQSTDNHAELVKLAFCYGLERSSFPHYFRHCGY